MPNTFASLSRRNFGALALAAGVPPKEARSQDVRPLTIGMLNDSSGTTSDLYGRGAVTDAELAIADCGLIVLGSPGGTIAELRAVIGLARKNKPIPIHTLPKDRANAALDALEHGRFTSRIVLIEAAA